MAKSFLRSDSCTNERDFLIKCVEENDTQEIERILSKDKFLLSHIYGYPYNNKTILHIACHDLADKVKKDTIKVLLQHGADLSFSTKEWNGNEALHFATLGLNPRILETVLEQLNEDAVNSTANGNTALNLLIKNGNVEDERFEECLKLLLKMGVDSRIADKKNNTPLYWAAKKKYLKAVLIFLQNNDAVSEKEAGVLKNLDLPVKYQVRLEKNDEFSYRYLLGILQDKRENNFVANFEHLKSKIDDAREEVTFLQVACEKNLRKAVKCLLENEYDPDGCTSKSPKKPIVIAATKGYYEIVQILLEKNCEVPKETLSEVLSKLDYDTGPDSDYKKIYDLLMKKNPDVNYQDNRLNFPLHYAGRYGQSEIVSKLLQEKASLANKNCSEILTISEIDFDVLEQHFDSCIEAVPYNRLDQEGLKFTFDYTTLIPTKRAVKSRKPETGQMLTEGHQSECDAVYFMSQSSELKYLLKHPLITSFLYIKWHQMRWIAYCNFIFYCFFCFSLILYISTDFAENDGKFSLVLLLLTTVILTFRELFQLIVTPKKYISNFENFIEVSLIVTLFLMLFWPAPDYAVKKQLCAVSLLLSAFEFLFLLGNFPAFSTNIVMLRTVSWNFCKFLSFYSILIFAYAFCFHTLFRNNTKELATTSSGNSSKDKNEKAEFFMEPSSSLFKTIIMLTGEYEAGEINFDQYPVTSHVIFLMFVLTIAVILLNLLNGLAVSDTQEIRNEAELVAHITRAQYVAYAESMIFSKLFPNCLRKYPWLGVSILRKPRFSAVKVSIADKYLVDGKLIVLPNQSGRVLAQDSFSCCSKNIYLNKTILKKARLLLQHKQEQKKKQQDELEINKKQELLLEKMDIILSAVNALNERKLIDVN